MKSGDVILNFADLQKIYVNGIPPKQLANSRQVLPLLYDSAFAVEFAYLVGKVMGDGHLDKNFSLSFVGKKNEIYCLKIHISKTFGLRQSKLPVKRRESMGVSYRLSVNNCLLGRILFLLGAPQGNKTKQTFLIPSWIVGNMDAKKAFLQALLEDELTTIKIHKCNYSIKPRLKMSKKEPLAHNLQEFLMQVKQAIESFGVKCSNISKPIPKKEMGSVEIYLDINREKQNIINFSNKIGFRIHKEKITCLKNCVDVLEKTKFNRKPEINVGEIIALRKQGFTFRQISGKTKVNRTTIHRIIKKYGPSLLISGTIF